MSAPDFCGAAADCGSPCMSSAERFLDRDAAVAGGPIVVPCLVVGMFAASGGELGGVDVTGSFCWSTAPVFSTSSNAGVTCSEVMAKIRVQSKEGTT